MDERCDWKRSKNQALLMQNFKETVSKINHDYENSLLSPLTITLGDEFQGLTKDLETALNIIIALEEEIIIQGFDFQLRYVLIYGDIETNINKRIAYEMLGEGLRDARYKLNSMKTNSQRFYIQIGDINLDSLLNNTFLIFENIIDKWNPEKDYNLISAFIKFNDYKIVAEKINKTRSQIWKREKTLNISSYEATKTILKSISKLPHALRL
ncbi:SatD family protein [Sphingobacterium sp. IITKGP-BTPF85]|uniref:SatD family protein n=1 Tax=Sphingobacterium sp. IITKGP-BTPF85 TaxID=1338009 RepID=UPI0021D1EE7A|nr:SatD family protein [Sphingobacterium sp. IITKGP-BTPF85]